MYSRHPVSRQENEVVVNSSSISNRNEELDFLKSTSKEIILAKNKSRSVFADGFTPFFTQWPLSRTTSGMEGSNSGNENGRFSLKL